MSTYTFAHAVRVAAFVCTAAAACAAQAQFAGTYVGTTSQGLPMEIKIEDDGAGNLVYTGNVTQFSMTCTDGGTKTQYWGVGAYQVIEGTTTYWETRGDVLYEDLKFKPASSGNKLKGTFSATMPLFSDVNTSLKKITRCETGPITFTIDYAVPTAAATANVPAVGRMIQR